MMNEAMLTPSAAADQIELAIYSDMFKDVYGVRPRNVTRVTPQMWDEIREAHVEAMDFHWHARQDAVKRFFRIVRSYLENGAPDLQTAVRWMYQASDYIDADDFLYEYGIVSFQLSRRVRRLLKETN